MPEPIPYPNKNRVITATQTGNKISVSGSMMASDGIEQTRNPDPNFSEAGVTVISFYSISNPSVNYNPGSLGSLAAMDSNGLHTNITIPASAGIPAGQYNLTVFLPGQGHKTVLVNVT
jgi:hypothetical protein